MSHGTPPASHWRVQFPRAEIESAPTGLEPRMWALFWGLLVVRLQPSTPIGVATHLECLLFPNYSCYYTRKETPTKSPTPKRYYFGIDHIFAVTFYCLLAGLLLTQDIKTQQSDLFAGSYFQFCGDFMGTGGLRYKVLTEGANQPHCCLGTVRFAAFHNYQAIAPLQ